MDTGTSRTRLLSRDDGAVAMLVAVLIVGLLAVAAIVVDVGAVYAHSRQLQTAADAAALAGVQALPGDSGQAIALAESYAQQNSAQAEELDFTIKSTWVTNDTIVAVVRDMDMGLFFARFLEIDSTPVGATATAMVGSPRAYGGGVMPFGIIASGTVEPPYGYEAGQEITLVCANVDSTSGNWHFVDLMGYSNTNNIKDLIDDGGTSKTLSIGDVVDPQTGSAMNPAFTSLSSHFSSTCAPHTVAELVFDDDRGVWDSVHKVDGTSCNRLITCPVVVATGANPYDWDALRGGSIPLRVVGFLNMFVSNDPKHKDGELRATFLQVVPENALKPGGLLDYAGVVTWLEN